MTDYRRTNTYDRGSLSDQYYPFWRIFSPYDPADWLLGTEIILRWKKEFSYLRHAVLDLGLPIYLNIPISMAGTILKDLTFHRKGDVIIWWLRNPRAYFDAFDLWNTEQGEMDDLRDWHPDELGTISLRLPNMSPLALFHLEDITYFEKRHFVTDEDNPAPFWFTWTELLDRWDIDDLELEYLLRRHLLTGYELIPKVGVFEARPIELRKIAPSLPLRGVLLEPDRLLFKQGDIYRLEKNDLRLFGNKKLLEGHDPHRQWCLDFVPALTRIYPDLRPGDAAKRLQELGLGTHVDYKQVTVWLKDDANLSRKKGRPRKRDNTAAMTYFKRQDFLRSMYLPLQPQKCLLTDY